MSILPIFISAARKEMELGPAGRQIQLEDPDGNSIELIAPAQ